MDTILIGRNRKDLPEDQLKRLLDIACDTPVVITPDRSAMEVFLDNLERYQAGEPLRNVVDKRLGY